MISRVAGEHRVNIPDIIENEKPQTKPDKKWKKTLAKVWNVVSKILLGLANAVFALSNPVVYPIAFLVGFVFNKQAQLVIDKIFIIWKKQPWAMTIGAGAVTAVAGVFYLQITMAVTSALFAAHLGATLSQKAQDLLEKENEKKKLQDDDTFKLI